MAEEMKTPESSTQEAVQEAVREAREEARRQADLNSTGTDEAHPTGEEEIPGAEAEADSHQEETVEANDTQDPDDREQEDSANEEALPGKKDPKDEKIADLTDRIARQMAEFDNFRKRTEKEKSKSFELGASSIIEKILPVVDNFERGLCTLPEGETDAFAEGMDKIYKQLVTTLADLGVSPIEALGQTFDPELHNAVMHVEDENFGENEIVEELLKGYKFHDRVIRHSMVKVAN